MIPLALGLVWLQMHLNNQPISWTSFSPAELDRNLKDGYVVLVNFRATWDIQTVRHEQLALEQVSVRRWIRAHHVMTMRADYTNRAPEITAALQSIGRVAIPAVAIYLPSSPDEPIYYSMK
ncbi:MAG: thioredoxin family protein [Pirellulales bacterium]